MTDRQKCTELYFEAFGDDGEFTVSLFNGFFDCCHYIKEGETVAAMLFLLPCELVMGDTRLSARYLFAAATALSHRGKGCMTRLIEKCLSESDEFIFLKPADEGLIKFYADRGFVSVTAVRSHDGECRIEVGEKFRELARGAREDGGEYILMYRADAPERPKKLAFGMPMD